MEKRKEKRIRSEVPYEDLSRSDKRRKTTRKKEEDVARRRGKKCDGGEGSKLSNEREMSTPEKEDNSDGTRKYAGSTCHQCKVLRSSETDLVFCSKCIKKRYCFDCILRWYPKRTPEEVQAACPFCMGNCNCKACLREPLAVKIPSKKDGSVKLKQLQYLLVKLLPVLRDIYKEQKRELEIETAIRGVPVTESDVIRCQLEPSERIFCDLCRTFISNFHRSCQDPDCSCHICLSCCKGLREGFHHPESDGKKNGEGTGNEGGTQTRQGKFYWELNSDGTIPCRPTELGGCGTSTLELRRLCECEGIEKLISSAEELTLQFKPPDVDIAHKFSSCTASSDSIRRQAASRKNGHDNFLYSPNAVDLSEDDIAHFQSHWIKAEPVIVRNVLEKTSGLSWEPMVMWRACREMDPKAKFKVDAKSVRAVDCLDWCEVEMNIHQFFEGYLKGRVHCNGWPEMLKLKDWPPASSFEERLPRHNDEFISALPFFDYTDPKSGILNLTTRLRERFMKRNLGPRIDIAYGFPEELNRGDSVTKLHFNITDSVNVLTHTAKVDISPWQYQRIKREQKYYEEAQLRKQYGGQRREASERGNGEALKKFDTLLGEQSLKDKETNEEPSDISPRPSGSQEGDCTNIERADHAGENYNDIGLKTEILSPVYPSEDGPTVENGLMMPTLPSTPPWDEEDSPPQPVVSTSAESIEEQKLDAPTETKGNANESSETLHGGAVWDIFRREDVPKLIEYLKRHKHGFRHLYNEPVKSVSVTQGMFLNERQKKQLKEEFDIEPWTFEQHLGEAVFIPAGCPHQLRNIQSCIKVALDFVAPESVEECLRLTEEFRRLPKDYRSNEDKLKLKKIVLHAASSAIREANKLMQKSMTQCDTYEACHPPIIHQYARRKAQMSKKAQQKRST